MIRRVQYRSGVSYIRIVARVRMEGEPIPTAATIDAAFAMV